MRHGAALKEDIMQQDNIVLLVEDDEDDEALTLRAFAENRIANSIVVVRDGVEALDYLLGNDPDNGTAPRPMPEVVLLDLKLPKVDGLEVLKRIRSNRRTRWLPVVILTSSTEEKDLVDSYDLGANSYIVKPVDFAQLVDAVRQLGLYWLVLNRTPSQPPHRQAQD